MAVTNRATITDTKGNRLYYQNERGQVWDYRAKKFIAKLPPLRSGQRMGITNPKGGLISYTNEVGKVIKYPDRPTTTAALAGQRATPTNTREAAARQQAAQLAARRRQQDALANPSTPGRTALWNDVLEAHPWLRSLGVSTARLKELAATASGASELMAKLRDEPAVKKRTQAMYRQDGSRRFATEAELFAWEDQVRDELRQAGIDVDRQYKDPADLIGFAEANLSAAQIRTRLQAWKGVKEAGDRAREVFYVYAGLTLSDDDLYEALVDPAAAQRLTFAANQATADKLAGPNAFSGWINRARQAGNARIVKIFTDAQKQGATYAATIQRVINVDPQFANQIMDSLYTGGSPDAGEFLDLTSLLDAYEFMAVGAAAVGAGLELPTKERLAEIRAAGIDRSRQIDAYQQFGMQRDRLNAAVQRARGETFTQTDFEQSAFFGDVEANRELEAAEAYMAAAGRSQGQFTFSRGERGQFQQFGLSAR